MFDGSTRETRDEPDEPHPDGGPDAAPAEKPKAGPRRKPWEPQLGERTSAFAAAFAYFELGADRSLAAAAEKCGKAKSLLARWSIRWKWAERARAYDVHMARLAQRAREKAVAKNAARWAERGEKIREREWTMSLALLDVAEKIVAQEGKYLKDCTLRDAASFLKIASELGRRAAEMPSRPVPPGAKGREGRPGRPPGPAGPTPPDAGTGETGPGPEAGATGGVPGDAGDGSRAS